MTRLPLLLCLILFTALAIGCRKDGRISGDEADLFGVWAKGPLAADTLYFVRENNKNIMRYHMFTSAGPQHTTETEYYLAGGKLTLKNFWGSGTDLGTNYKVESFKWKQKGQEFDVLGPEIYPYMSAVMTATFKKVP